MYHLKSVIVLYALNNFKTVSPFTGVTLIHLTTSTALILSINITRIHNTYRVHFSDVNMAAISLFQTIKQLSSSSQF